MTGTEIALIITALGTLLTAIAGMIVSLRNSAKISVIHNLTNSMSEKLLTSTADAAEATGKAAGLERGLAEGKAQAATLAEGQKQGRDERKDYESNI